MHYNDWLKENPDGTPREYVAWARADDVRPNLSRADLRRANLRGADLTWADLSRAIGPVTTFSAGRHTAIFAGGYGSIGCVRHSYKEWLEEYVDIGMENDYMPDEIADYGDGIRWAVARQWRIEAVAVEEEQ